ncbi:MAG: sugar ABC transporter permease [Lachnospiraceae bacterium]|nr:sugar ABC transporter permease [Lachnospiraceae bacterium]
MQKVKGIKNNLSAYGFLSPWFIGFVLFIGGPIIASIVLSFTRWNLLGTPEFFGLQNYVNMFMPGSGFLNSLRATLFYTVISVTVSVFASLFMAVLLNFRVKFRGIFQFCFFAPAVMPTVALAFVFQLIFNQHMGILNYGLSRLGIAIQPNWLNDPFWVWVSMGIVTVFTYSTGQMMLIFNAALKDVPQAQYEAADVEGANFFQRFWHVTIPNISPIILFNVVVGTVNSFNTAFSIVFPLTNGGPANETMVLSLELYNSAFGMFNMGHASAVATVLFVIVAIVGALQFRLSKKAVHYD